VTHAPRGIASIRWTADMGEVRFDDGGSVTARLIVGADGVRSRVREAAGIVALPKPYGQTAVVANFACERAHHGRAHQWFRDDGGILAWLPLPGRRISLVWSAPEHLAQELLTLDASTLALAGSGRQCARRFHLHHAGRAPRSVPEVTHGRRASRGAVGDAAHGVHPLAGQGVNLDSATSRRSRPCCVTAARSLMPGAGAAERYARLRAGPVRAMQTVTDALAHLFRSAPFVRSARNQLSAVERMPAARRSLAQSALR
jgi:2-octaprenyl-6-methoxyphenol hydroxylase